MFTQPFIQVQIKNPSKLRITDLCEGNSPVTVNSPHKGPVTRKMFSFDDVIVFPQLSPRACFYNKYFGSTNHISQSKLKRKSICMKLIYFPHNWVQNFSRFLKILSMFSGHKMWFGTINSQRNFASRQTSSISRTKSKNLKRSRAVLQLSLPNPLKPSVMSRMNDRRCSNYSWVINNCITY